MIGARLLLPALLLAGCEQRQEWVSSQIDGTQRSDFRLTTRGDRIVGGYDGCNAWGRDDPDSEIISIDLEGCPDDPVRRAYWKLATSRDAIIARQEARLVIRTGAHQGTFVPAP